MRTADSRGRAERRKQRMGDCEEVVIEVDRRVQSMLRDVTQSLQVAGSMNEWERTRQGERDTTTEKEGRVKTPTGCTGEEAEQEKRQMWERTDGGREEIPPVMMESLSESPIRPPRGERVLVCVHVCVCVCMCMCR